MVTVTNAADLRTALDRLVAERVDRAITTVVYAVSGYVVEEWISSDFTWSRYQPGPVHSGQSRASIRASRGSPSLDYAPDNPGSWPIHENPYPMPDPHAVLSGLAGLQPYEMAWVSNAVPHAADVERHTMGAHAAAEFAKSHYRPGYQWSGMLR